MSTAEQVKVAEEFPGLERHALGVFGISYAELAPRLQGVIRKLTVQDAAEDVLAALKVVQTQLDCPARNTNRGYRYAEATVISSDIRQQVKEAIAKADGRQ